MTIRSVTFALLAATLAWGPGAGAADSVSVDQATTAFRELVGAGLEPGAALVTSSAASLPASLASAVTELRRRGDTAAAQRLATAWADAIAETMPPARAAAQAQLSRVQPRDPMAILAGGDDAATQYFRGSSEDAIARAIQPTVRDAIGHSRLADAFRAFSAALSSKGLDSPGLHTADLERAVTDATLRELFRDVAAREARLRHDPSGASASLKRALSAART